MLTSPSIFSWCISKLVPRNSRTNDTLHFLLDHPRRCFIYLFPAHQTWFLLTVLVVLKFVPFDYHASQADVFPNSARRTGFSSSFLTSGILHLSRSQSARGLSLVCCRQQLFVLLGLGLSPYRRLHPPYSACRWHLVLTR